MSVQHRLFRQWRICATALAFITFMIGSIVFTVTLIPITQFLPGSADSKRYKILQLIHISFKMIIKFVIILKIISKFEVEGIEDFHHDNSCLLIANHPTLIDVIAIMSCIPFCNCIVKKSLLRHAFFGRIVRAAGYIVNDHATQLIQDCEKTFQVGRPLIVFPEGTRSPIHSLHAFKRGAAQISLRTGVPVVLVVITCDPPILSKGQAWYKVPERPVSFKLHFHLLSTPSEKIHQKHPLPLQVRALNQCFEEFFRERLHIAPHTD